MGKVLEEVEKREKEKHIDTDEYISLLHWYIKESAKIDREFIETRNAITAAFNARRREMVEDEG